MKDMCIKGGKILHIKAKNTNEAIEKLDTTAMPGDAVAFYRKGYKHYAIYISENWLIDYSDPHNDATNEKHDAQARWRSSPETVYSSLEFDVHFCCKQVDCVCREMAVSYAIQAVEEAAKDQGPYARGKYNVLKNNCEHFCFECVHHVRYSSQSHYGKRYGLTPLASGTTGAATGAAIGFGVGLSGGPFAAVTLPVGVGVGAMLGGGIAFTSSVAIGGVLHGIDWNTLKQYCSYNSST